VEFIIATLSSMFASAGGWIAAVLAAIAALFGGVVYHKTKVSKAEKTGKADGAAIERDRIRQDTEQAQDYLEQRANEIEDEVRRDTATDDDLRQRMRDAAKADDRGAKP
jgi:hypothetical protein